MQSKEYTGLGKRFIAFFLDYFIVVIFGGLIFLASKYFLMPSLNNDSYTYFAWATAFFYFVLLESSFLQGTFGKVLYKMKVVNADGGRLSILNAIGRFFAKFLSALILGIGFFMIAFTKNKQGLHDKLAKTYVVKIESYDELTQGNVNKFLFVILKSVGWVISLLLMLILIVFLVSSLFNSQAAKDTGNFLALVVGGLIWIAIIYGAYKIFFKVTGADKDYLAAKMFTNTMGDFRRQEYKVKQKGDFTSSTHRTKESAISMSEKAENECYIYYKKRLLGVWYKGKFIRDEI